MAKQPSRRIYAGPARKAGLAPGTIVFVGDPRTGRVRVDVIDYSADALHEHRDATVDQCGDLAAAPSVTWINIDGVHDKALIEALGARFGLHPLTLEDIANTYQRPKVEAFPKYIYIVLKMVLYDEAGRTVRAEHVSLVLGESWVLSFLEDEGDVFDSVRARIRNGDMRLRSRGSDFLAYTLMDTVVDHYFLAVEGIGDHIEEIDDRILDDPEPDDLHEVHRLKRSLLSLRKAVWPLREEVRSLEKSDSPLIHPDTRPFLRDIYDHTIVVIDMLETFRDILGGMHDTYLSGVSNRMNEVMKMLTIIATIFIPLTFIVGVYGMNFEHMPELAWRWGYFAVWGVMLALGAGMLVYFRRKGWM